MTTEQQVEMHQQHRDAQSELTSWLDDIYMWRAEHKQALSWLTQIAASIHEYDSRLQRHSDLVDKQERHIRRHEHEISLQEQQHRFADSTALDDEHDEFAANQVEARDTHARIGTHHRTQMANLKRLLDQFVEQDR